MPLDQPQSRYSRRRSCTHYQEHSAAHFARSVPPRVADEASETVDDGAAVDHRFSSIFRSCAPRLKFSARLSGAAFIRCRSNRRRHSQWLTSAFSPRRCNPWRRPRAVAACRKRLECALAFDVVPSKPIVRLAAAPRRPSASVVAKKRTLSVGRVRQLSSPPCAWCAPTHAESPRCSNRCGGRFQTCCKLTRCEGYPRFRPRRAPVPTEPKP